MDQLTVRPMSESEYEEWIRDSLQSYADEQVGVGNWAAEGAYDRAAEENAVLLPAGRRTEGMLFLIAADDAGRPVGVLWLSLGNPRGTPDCGYIYDIEVYEEFRGRGLGRALLAAAEQAMLAHGVHALLLNVFGDNDRAKNLYASAGYAVISQQMRKSLT